MKPLKRIAAIHDISGFGKCSLTVALPILSAAGIETAVVPTAVLSTHTGGFTGFTYRDLTDDIAPFTDHWRSLELRFDAVYTGFLGSFRQIDLVERFFDAFKTDNNLLVVDPVMADNGQLYTIFPADFPEGMRRLCQKADLILPNLTEAALLTHQPYQEGPYTPDYIEDMLHKLAELGPQKIVLTGVFFNDHELGAATYNVPLNQVAYAFEPRIPGYYHGTGDVFGSALLAAFLNDFSLSESAALAARFTTSAIQKTRAAATDIRFGVNFEQTLPEFLRDLKLV